jgi:hypothetical protein
MGLLERVEHAALRPERVALSSQHRSMNISSTSSLHDLTSAFSSCDMNGKPEIDYSLYLVTARELLPPGKVSFTAR